MSRPLILALALTCALSSTPSVSQPGGGGATVRVRFEGLRPEGAVSVALFPHETAWRSRDGARSLIQPVQGGHAEATFTGLAPGRYRVMAYHDRNGDGRLNTLPVGLPTEPYGFSNNARGTFGPPGWRAASFAAAEGETVHAIRLR